MYPIRRLFPCGVKHVKNVNSFNKSSYYSQTSQNFVVHRTVIKHYSPVNVFSVKFHTSRPNHALPPLLWTYLRTVLKLVAILFGRGIRKWWQAMPKNKQKHFLKLLHQKKYTIFGSCAALSVLPVAYYFYHLEEHPLTKRKRFIVFSYDQILQLTNIQILLEEETHRHKILPITDPKYRRVERVVRQLLHGNSDLPEVKEKEWGVTVVDSKTIDAFVFLNGHIFVFAGTLEQCTTDDQLSIILGHEMAHAILGHVGEKLSNAHIAEMLFIIPLVILWSVFPDTAAFLFQMISSYFLRLVVELPYSRTLEKEADEFGLQLAAKSCFDVRQASAFWEVMSKVDPVSNEIEFLSTHPSHEHRKEILEQLIPLALHLRKLCKCPDLN